MRVYVMRHGPAEDEATSGRDEDRALTHRGRERVRDVGKALLADGESPSIIFSSPLVRALQTAEIVAAVISLTEHGGTVVAQQDLEPGGDCMELIRSLASSGTASVMVVGHEPDLSSLVRRMVGKAVPVTMDKATVVGLDVAIGKDGGKDDGWEVALRFMLEPKSLKWHFDSRSDGK